MCDCHGVVILFVVISIVFAIVCLLGVTKFSYNLSPQNEGYIHIITDSRHADDLQCFFFICTSSLFLSVKVDLRKPY